MKHLTTTLVFVWPLLASAATFTAVQTGPWSSPATWGGAASPGADGDVAIIPAGIWVDYNTNNSGHPNGWGSIKIDGVLTMTNVAAPDAGGSGQCFLKMGATTAVSGGGTGQITTNTGYLGKFLVGSPTLPWPATYGLPGAVVWFTYPTNGILLNWTNCVMFYGQTNAWQDKVTLPTGPYAYPGGTTYFCVKNDPTGLLVSNDVVMVSNPNFTSQSVYPIPYLVSNAWHNAGNGSNYVQIWWPTNQFVANDPRTNTWYGIYPPWVYYYLGWSPVCALNYPAGSTITKISRPIALVAEAGNGNATTAPQYGSYAGGVNSSSNVMSGVRFNNWNQAPVVSALSPSPQFGWTFDGCVSVIGALDGSTYFVRINNCIGAWCAGLTGALNVGTITGCYVIGTGGSPGAILSASSGCVVRDCWVENSQWYGGAAIGRNNIGCLYSNCFATTSFTGWAAEYGATFINCYGANLYQGLFFNPAGGEYWGCYMTNQSTIPTLVREPMEGVFYGSTNDVQDWYSGGNYRQQLDVTKVNETNWLSAGGQVIATNVSGSMTLPWGGQWAFVHVLYPTGADPTTSYTLPAYLNVGLRPGTARQVSLSFLITNGVSFAYQVTPDQMKPLNMTNVAPALSFGSPGYWTNIAFSVTNNLPVPVNQRIWLVATNSSAGTNGFSWANIGSDYNFGAN